MRCQRVLSPAIAIALAAGLLVAPAANAETFYATTAAADTVAPKLVSVKLTSAPTIDPAGAVTFNWTIDDAGTGLDYVAFDVSDAKSAAAGSTTKITSNTAISGGFRTSGTTNITPNRVNMKPGKLTVNSIALTDKAGNTTNITAAATVGPLTVTINNPNFDDARPVITGTWSKASYAPGERAVFNWKLTDANVNPSVTYSPKLRLQDGVYLRNVLTSTTATAQTGYSYWDVPDNFEYGQPLKIVQTSTWDKFSNWQNVTDMVFPSSIVKDDAHPLADVKFTGTPGAGQKLTIDTTAWKGAAIKVSWYAGVNSLQVAKTGSTFTFPTAASGYSPNHPFTVTVTGTWPDKTVRTRNYVGLSSAQAAAAVKPGAISITGKMQVGNKLTGNTSGWPAGYELVGQWKFADGTPAAPLGAKSINLTEAHSLKTLQFCVTATKANMTSTGTCSTTPIARGDFGDLTSTVHWDKGFKTRAVVGDTATMTFVEPRVPGVKVTYQWRVGGVDIPGATGKTFKIPANAAGKYVSSYIAITAPGYNYKSVWPQGSTAATATAGDAVVIAGQNKVGNTLTAKAGYWTTGTKLSHEWLRNGKRVKWGEKYTLTAADANKYITVRTTAYRTGGETVIRTSSSIGKTAYGSYPAAKFTIQGYTKNSGANLWVSQKSGKVTGQKLTYQWYRNGKAIKGATKSKYLTTKSDQAREITLKTTRSAPGYKGKSTTTSNKLVVKPGSLKKVTAKINGKAAAGKTLSVKRTASTQGTTYKYQWYKNGKAIKGATKWQYKVNKKDKKASIQTRIVLSKAGFYNRTVWTNKVKIAK